MSVTGADVDALTELRIELTSRRRDLAGVTDDATDAIARFSHRSTQFVPQLPAHAASVAALEERMVQLNARIGRSRDALRAADRWAGTNWALQLFELESGRQDVVAAASGAALGWQAFRAATVEGRPPPVVPPALTTWSDDVARALGRMSPQVREVAAGAGRHSRARAVVANTRVAAVARLGSRGIGAAGAVVGIVSTAQSWREGDTEGVVTGSLSTASSIAMATGIPALVAAGAVVQGGLLVYEHREKIAGAATAIAGWLADGDGELF